MSRWRFWLSQFVWLVMSLFVFGATTGDGTITNPSGAMFFAFLGFVISGFILAWGNFQGAEKNVNTIQRPNVFMRSAATMFMWLVYMAGVFISLIEVGAIAILLAFILMVPLVFLSAFMWGLLDRRPPQSATQSLSASATDYLEKRKRDRLDAVLKDLSNDDLERLRQRLSDGTVQEEQLRYMLSDDGELLIDGR